MSIMRLLSIPPLPLTPSPTWGEGVSIFAKASLPSTVGEGIEGWGVGH